MSAHLDWSDLAAVRRLLVDLRAHVDDIDGVVKDMLAKKRRRNLGHRQHRRLYRDARESVLAAIEHAMPPEPTPVQQPEGRSRLHRSAPRRPEPRSRKRERVRRRSGSRHLALLFLRSPGG